MVLKWVQVVYSLLFTWRLHPYRLSATDPIGFGQSLTHRGANVKGHPSWQIYGQEFLTVQTFISNINTNIAFYSTWPKQNEKKFLKIKRFVLIDYLAWKTFSLAFVKILFCCPNLGLDEFQQFKHNVMKNWAKTDYCLLENVLAIKKK